MLDCRRHLAKDSCKFKDDINLSHVFAKKKNGKGKIKKEGTECRSIVNPKVTDVIML